MVGDEVLAPLLAPDFPTGDRDPGTPQRLKEAPENHHCSVGK